MENSTRIKGPHYAADAIAYIARETLQDAARKAMARAAIGHHGNYTPEAKDLWQDYLDAGCPRAS